jgi:hypothetical protein
MHWVASGISFFAIGLSCNTKKSKLGGVTGRSFLPNKAHIAPSSRQHIPHWPQRGDRGEPLRARKHMQCSVHQNGQKQSFGGVVVSISSSIGANSKNKEEAISTALLPSDVPLPPSLLPWPARLWHVVVVAPPLHLLPSSLPVPLTRQPRNCDAPPRLPGTPPHAQ